ncbi:YsnF/AvaK domain-containing protein [Mesobacillus foraminis]|uniref:Uncharacterized protein (TIGR02271 family) n=1 Tax=Mesobacillus foraminis TaxID=279826 RepID=A0A4R2BLG0_9BACI|nr:YsnF/AvaK domain-containing protein [Mesobacillus foraminis]TCN27382.1 uncharacterized protein (TIGR02271 family) [Mesobacillus foraminis]
MNSNIIGVYDSQQEVMSAIQDLQDDGFRVRDLGIIARTANGESTIEDETGANALEFETDKNHHNDDDLVNTLAHLYDDVEFNEERTIGRFLELGLSREQAREYASYVENGKIILYNENQGPGTGNGTAVSGYNITSDTRSGRGLSSGTGIHADTQQTLWDTDDQEQTMKLREEELNVTKNPVKTGEVTVHKDVIEEQKNIEVPVTREELYIERRKADGTSPDGAPIGDGETIRIPIKEEKVNVSKQEMVTEELVIGKRQVQDTEQVTETVRKEEVRLEEDGRISQDRNLNKGYRQKNNDL